MAQQNTPSSDARNKAAPRRRGGREGKREMRFPDWESKIWRQKRIGGWAAMPKTLLLIAQIIGKVEGDPKLPIAMIGLWLATWADGFVDVQSEHRLALECGFEEKQPAKRLHNWRKAIRTLARLGFVEAEPKEGPHINYILILDPHRAISELYDPDKSKLSPDLESAGQRLRKSDNLKELVERLRDKAVEVGATGIDSLIANPSRMGSEHA